MKTIPLHILMLSITISVVLSSCKKASDDPAPAQDTGNVNIEFDNQFMQSPSDPEVYIPLKFNDTTYKNAAGEEYTISMFKYYISNIKLKKSDGSYYNVPESYFLIDATTSTDAVINLTNIPAAIYTGMSYTIGVDSARCVSGAQTGALDPANGMFWSWNSGYIFLKLEGTSPQSTATGNVIQYHIGGFENANNTNALQTVNLDFNTYELRVTKVGTPEVHITVEAGKVMENTTIATTPAIHMPGAAAITISENYKDMFIFEHIHN